MTTLREAAQQALEAYDAHEPLAVVMEELRAALAEPVQEPCNKSCAPGYCYCECPHGVADGDCKECYAEKIEALDLPPSGTATVRDFVRIIERAHGIGESNV